MQRNFQYFVTHVTGTGFNFEYQLADSVSGGKLYWMVINSGSSIPSMADVRDGSSGICSGFFNQIDGSFYKPIECSLSLNSDHEFWIVLDNSANGISGNMYKLDMTTGKFIF